MFALPQGRLPSPATALPILRRVSPSLPRPISCCHRKKDSGEALVGIPPARDWVIKYGKYMGLRMGSLPSKYLKWMANNPVHEDCHLAQQVLADPVYRDRIEWEETQRFRRNTGYIPKELIGARFGWDMENKEAWDKINYRLLGTSFGGRIPRKRDRVKQSGGSGAMGSHGNLSGDLGQSKEGSLGSKPREIGSSGSEKDEEKEGVKDARARRRERRRQSTVGGGRDDAVPRPNGRFLGRELLVKMIDMHIAEDA